MTTCPDHDLVERLADELHAEGLARTDRARRTFRESFPTEEAYREHMRRLAAKSRLVRVKNAQARRRAKAIERLNAMAEGAA